MIARMVHAEENGYRAEHAKLAPAQIEVGVVVGILLKAAHAVRPVANTRQTDVQTAANDGLKPLPLRAPVASPDERVALDAGISLARMGESALVVQLHELVVRSPGIGDGKQVVQLCGTIVAVVCLVETEGTAHIGLYKFHA